MAGVVSLDDYIQTAAPKPFAYGHRDGVSIDCAHFALGWLEKMAGRPISTGVADYFTEAQVKRILARAGGLEAYGRRFASTIPGLLEIEEGAPVRAGDIGVIAVAGKSYFAIASENDEWCLKQNLGVIFLPAAGTQTLRQWRYGGGAVGADPVGQLILAALAIANTTFQIGSAAISLAQIVGTIVITAASIGLQYAISALVKPGQPSQAQQQQTIRQAVGYRQRHYGTVQVGGQELFREVKDGLFYRLICVASGEIDGFVQHKLGDKVYTFSAVYPYPAIEQPIDNAMFIDTRLGLDSQTSYQQLIDAFPGAWTEDHKCNGLATVLVTAKDRGKYNPDVFKGNVLQWRGLIRGAKLYDSREGGHDPDDSSTWGWNDTAALCIQDYCTHADGMGWTIDDLDLPSWEDAADMHEEAVALKAGGTEKRYRLCGSYHFGEPRKAPLQRMLDACDGRLRRSNGKIQLRGGKFYAPIVSLSETSRITRSWKLGVDATERVNELKPVFVSPSHDYQETEAAARRDEAAITSEGLTSQRFDLPMVPSHSQAQRLAEIRLRRMRAPRRGQQRRNLAGLLAWEQETARVVEPRLSIDHDFLIESQSILIDPKSVGLDIVLTQTSADHFAWNAATDEGDPPPIPATTASDAGIETPANVNVSVDEVVVSEGVIGGQLHVTWDLPDAASLTPEVRYRNKVGGVYGPYQGGLVEPDDTDFLSGVIANDGTIYEVEVRFLTGRGATSDWTTPFSVVALSGIVGLIREDGSALRREDENVMKREA